MTQYKEGWVRVPGAERIGSKGDYRWRTREGKYYREKPGGGNQVVGEILWGSGWRGMSQFDNPASGETKGGVAPQTSNPFAPNFQPFYTERFDQSRKKEPEATKKPYVSKYKDLTTGDATQNTGISKLDTESYGNNGESADQLVSVRTGGRGDVRSIPGGGSQTGTNTSAISMPGLEEFSRYAGADIANFAGPSFPTEPSTNKITNGYANTNAAFNVDPSAVSGAGINISDSAGASEAIAMEGNKFNASNFRDMGGNYADFSKDNYKMGGKFHGAPTPTEGLADPNKRGTQIDEDMEFGGPDPASYARSNQEMSRRSAFLDAPDSMQGLRNVEAGLGMVYAGGKHYANVNGEMNEMNSKDARAYKAASGAKAQALKDAYVTSLTSAKSEEQIAGTSPAALQAPNVDTSLSTGSAQNQLRPEAFNEDGPNFGISPTTQPINIQKPQETQDINVGKDKNKVNAANFTGGASPFGTFNATKFNL